MSSEPQIMVRMTGMPRETRMSGAATVAMTADT